MTISTNIWSALVEIYNICPRCHDLFSFLSSAPTGAGPSHHVNPCSPEFLGSYLVTNQVINLHAIRCSRDREGIFHFMGFNELNFFNVGPPKEGHLS